MPQIEDTAQLADYDYIALVYITDVQEIKRSTSDEWPNKAKISVEIMTLFKGDSIIHFLDLTRNGCDYSIEQEQEWILFAIKNKGTFQIQPCDYNQLYREADGKKHDQIEDLVETLSDLYGLKKVLPENGIETSYYRNGNKEKETAYEQGKIHGYLRYWHPNGFLKSETNFVNGKPIGWSKSYYENGNLSYKTFYTPDGEKDGLSQGFYIHGQLKSESYSKNGVSYGVYRTYFDTVLSEHEIKWMMEEYFPGLDSASQPWRNIQIHQEWVYDNNGNRVIWREYYPNGKIKKEEIFDIANDFKTLVHYYSNGKLKAIGYKKNGKDYGHYQWYNKDGTVGRSWDYD